MSAIYQLEAQFDLTNTGGTPFASTRNSNVGLKGNFGTVFYGNCDTPYKVALNKVELFDNTHTVSALDITGRVGTADGNASQHPPEERPPSGPCLHAAERAAAAITCAAWPFASSSCVRQSRMKLRYARDWQRFKPRVSATLEFLNAR